MKEKRIKEVESRIKFITMELVHEGYLPGIVVKGFKNELAKLEAELKELKELK
jgi:hypothetical protein